MQIFMTVNKLSVHWYSMNGRWKVFSVPGWKQQRYDLSGKTGKGKSWVMGEKLKTGTTEAFGASWCLMCEVRWLSSPVRAHKPMEPGRFCLAVIRTAVSSAVATRHCTKPSALRNETAGRAAQQLCVKASRVKQGQFTEVVVHLMQVREMSWSEDSIQAQDPNQQLLLDMNKPILRKIWTACNQTGK